MGESMVSRVAKSFEWAVSLNCHDEGCRCLTERERWECLTGTYPEEIARAAIEAMREPTNAMVKAHKGARYRANGQMASKTEAIREGHRAAIDAALSTTDS